MVPPNLALKGLVASRGKLLHLMDSIRFTFAFRVEPQATLLR